MNNDIKVYMIANAVINHKNKKDQHFIKGEKYHLSSHEYALLKLSCMKEKDYLEYMNKMKMSNITK